jgi:uncharacterized membrane protein YkvA (DUF1232 family)
MTPRWTSRLREKARAIKRETLTLYFAIRDPRAPLAARIVAGVVVAYALSPIDLIPDFIPVLGLLDDLILVPLGIALCLRLIPAPILAEARVRAEGGVTRPKSYAAAAVIVLAWFAASALFCAWFYRQFLAK